jgi:prevent-host-death family protein
MSRVIPIGEARRRLPELVRKIASGDEPVTIGRRGRPEVVLLPAGSSGACEMSPLPGLVQLVGDVEEGSRAMRGEIGRSLELTAAFIATGPTRRSRKGAERRR